MNVPKPIFANNLSRISWIKIYEREYGVQYSEVAVSLLAFATYHFPTLSLAQVVIPGTGKNTAFFIDAASWIKLVKGLNKKYTSSSKNLAAYEKLFLIEGKNYLQLAKKIAKTNIKNLSDKELLSLFLDHNEKHNRYSVFAWSAFILNNYIADKATKILDTYIEKDGKQNQKQEIYDSLFAPEKRAAVLQLQYEVEQKKGKLSKQEFDALYEKYKWLPCLNIHNQPWTKEEFRENIQPFASSSPKKIIPFTTFTREFSFTKKDLAYLLMAKRFVYTKDARDDFRREGVFYSQSLFKEIGERMNINPLDTTYLQEQEVIDFLSKGVRISSSLISQRKKGFVMYIDDKKNLVCLCKEAIPSALKILKMPSVYHKAIQITGRVASQGQAKGKVIIVKGVKDLRKVEIGNILVAVSTHPDYVTAMRKAAAIITDEGGITSHAAIVSREFGIPCIVGCNNATTILQNGDAVEVDAMEGKVIKL